MDIIKAIKGVAKVLAKTYVRSVELSYDDIYDADEKRDVSEFNDNDIMTAFHLYNPDDLRRLKNAKCPNCEGDLKIIEAEEYGGSVQCEFCGLVLDQDEVWRVIEKHHCPNCGDVMKILDHPMNGDDIHYFNDYALHCPSCGYEMPYERARFNSDDEYYEWWNDHYEVF